MICPPLARVRLSDPESEGETTLVGGGGGAMESEVISRMIKTTKPGSAPLREEHNFDRLTIKHWSKYEGNTSRRKRQLKQGPLHCTTLST